MHPQKKHNYKLVLKYDGSNYLGWQAQKSGQTIQQAVEEAIYNLLGEHVCLYSSGRTDAGVHALGLTVNFFTDKELLPSRTADDLNRILPRDISVVDFQEVSLGFHKLNAIAESMRCLRCDRRE